MHAAMVLPEPTAEELQDLSLACAKLWDLDENRLQPCRDYEINLQVACPALTVPEHMAASSMAGAVATRQRPCIQPHGASLSPSFMQGAVLQVGKRCFEEYDAAPLPLFPRVDVGALQGRRTYAAFCSLLDNYERCCSVGTMHASCSHPDCNRSGMHDMHICLDTAIISGAAVSGKGALLLMARRKHAGTHG